ncbi:MAG TPA: DUF1588 domain-containing protein [Polyangiaceae bacterium]|nr:DUF1588 domain-containing protein [Polyangiaceae bacterium]
MAIELGRWSRALALAGALPATLGCAASSGAGSEQAPADSAPVVPVLTGMHRLNSTEYNATVRDTLGTRLQPASSSWRGGELGGFDNIASQLGVDEAQYDRYFRAAQALATDVMASDSLRAAFIDCDLAHAPCVEASLRRVGRRLFRRPLEPDELESYRRVYDAALALGDDATSAFQLTLVAVLSSVQFLYRIELDPLPEAAETHSLSSYELASRLSYFLWSSAPDEALLDAAADGSLLQDDGLAAAVERMLGPADVGDIGAAGDAKAWRFVESFAGQWLGERQVPSHASPAWSAREARAAAQEMLYYFNDFLQSERSWLEFPTADFNYVNGELPFLYDMPVPDVFGSPPPDDWTSTEQFRRVQDAQDQRAGFFGLAGFLALTSFDRRTSPSKRGKWIAGNMLCAEPPPPAQVLPSLETEASNAPGLSPLAVRQRLEEHRKNPACASCHALFDPYGLAIEHFDPIGRYRDNYDDGSPIDAVGLAEISQQVAEDPRFAPCLAHKLLTYALGHVVSDADEQLLAPIVDTWLAPDQAPSLRRLIRTIVASKAFRYRRGAR